ncbi:hypothetical protein C2E23DRAFT_885466 [Lenzites betulinus]|nr:hypothetical protein C2E23DRAFT_885466 [Lenzites betulinus]
MASSQSMPVAPSQADWELQCQRQPLQSVGPPPEFEPPAINRLPLEIIIYIFKNLLDDTYDLDPGVPQGPQGGFAMFHQDPRPWRFARLVCRAWNNHICATPALWQEIQIIQDTKISWVLISLERSAKATLDVLLHDCADLSMIAYLPLFIPHTQRLRSLIFYKGIEGACMPQLQTLFRHDTQALQQLWIKPSQRLDVNAVHDLELSHTRQPRLRSLTMMQVRLTADVALLANLRRLSLGWTSTAFTFCQFREALALNPRLEKLVLTKILDRFADWHTATSAHAAEPITPITLPHLVSLRVEVHSPAVTSAFLSQLHLPAVRFVCLQARMGEAAANPNLEHTGNLGSNNAPSWPAMFLPPRAIRAVSPLLMCEAATIAMLDVNRDRYALEVSDDAGGKLHLALVVVGSNHTPQMNVGLAGLLDVCGSAVRIERLTLLDRYDGNDGVTREEWGAVLDAFPALQNLTICWPGDMEPLWTALQGVGDGDGAAGLGVLPCPRLKCVDYQAPIGRWTCLDGLNAGVRALVECFERRARRGSRLQNLDFLVRTGVGSYPPDYVANEHDYCKRLTAAVDEVRYWCRYNHRSMPQGWTIDRPDL